MALLTINYYSRALKRKTEINVILPSDTPFDEQVSDGIRFVAEYPALYLYHGVYGDNSDWLLRTSIEDWAMKYKVAVILPSLENHFGLNLGYGNDYLTFLSTELPSYMENWLPISGKRALKWTAGLSMGGYAAYSVALRNPEKFGRAISLSGGLNLKALVKMQLEGISGLPFDGRDFFGTCLSREENDILHIFQEKSKNHEMPLLYQACGTEDFLYQVNIKARDALKKIGADLFYEEGPGAHEWDFWDTYIDRAINWATR